MNDDIVTRLRDGNHDMDALNCASCDAFCCECELCDCCVEALNSRNEAADEIERLRTDRDRWKVVALCVHCRPAAGNYCTDHYKSMNAPRPWGTPT